MQSPTPKYDTIGKSYNSTRKADPYLLNRMYAHLYDAAYKQYLDIGCGTGNYTIALSNMGLPLIGVDPSSQMLNKAKQRNNDIDWRKGHAENIPMEVDSVDAGLATLTLHHWSDLELGFSELNRVLRKHGKLVIFTSTPEQMKSYWLNHYFPEMMADSINQMPSYTAISSALSTNDFDIINEEKYFIRHDLQDKFLNVGKENPAIYLDAKVRQGISSFSSLANKTEIEKGLIHLKSDINSGKIAQVVSSYQNEKGDYLFIIAKKA